MRRVCSIARMTRQAVEPPRNSSDSGPRTDGIPDSDYVLLDSYNTYVVVSRHDQDLESRAGTGPGPHRARQALPVPEPGRAALRRAHGLAVLFAPQPLFPGTAEHERTRGGARRPPEHHDRRDRPAGTEGAG